MKSWAFRTTLVLKYLRLYRREVVLLVGLSLFSAFFQALSPFFAGHIVDDLIGKSQSVFFFFYLWLGTQCIMNLNDWYSSVRSRYLDEKIFADYIVSGISHLIELPLGFHKEKKIGDIENRLQRAAQNLSTIITSVIISLLPQFLSIAIAIVFAFVVKPLLAILLIFSTSIYLIILLKAGPRFSVLLRKMHRAYNKAFGESYDTLLNVQSVKQAGAEKYEKKRLYQNFHLRALKYINQMNFVWQIMSSSQRVLVTLTQGGIYALSIYFISRGAMTVGQLVMFNGYAALFLGPFVILSNNWHVVQNGLASLERAEKIFTEKPEEYENAGSVILADIKGEIEYRGVSFRYGKKHKTVLENISFSAKHGEVIALVGESGVGKSTLVDFISRYYEVTSGTVLIDDHDVKKLNIQFLRSKIAVVPQEILLFNDTIKNNIRYGSFGASDRRIAEAARIAHADEFIENFPKKYKQMVGERGVKLSVGQKRRRAIARAVLRNPRILILDEPTSALDAKSEQFVQSALRKLMEGRTTFIIAHRLSTVRHADKILVLEKGRVVEKGRHEELIKIDGGVYQKLYNLQIGLKV